MILAIDFGTSYYKFSLFDRSGGMARSSRVVPCVERPRNGWAELEAADFLDAVDQGIGEVFNDSAYSPGDVEAITFATQANTFLLLDESDRPLTPFYLWNDTRAAEFDPQVRELARLNGFTARTGVPDLGPEFMVAKLLWIAQHRKDSWDQTSRLCLLTDYLTLRMTGRHATEVGHASLTGLVDAGARVWWKDALDHANIPKDWMPEIVDSGEALGTVNAEAQSQWGFRSGCRFVAGSLDQYCGALGVGNTALGVLSETTGTVLAAICCTSDPQKPNSPEVYQGPAFHPGRFFRMTFGNLSANYLYWYREHLADGPTYDELSDLAATIGPGADGLRLNRHTETPADALASVSDRHPRGRVVRAIMEAVAVALYDHVSYLLGETEDFFTEVRSAGGGACSETWLQIKADVLGLPVHATDCAEPTSLGAAVLAEANLTAASPAEVARDWVRLQPPLEPDAQTHAFYREALLGEPLGPGDAISH